MSTHPQYALSPGTEITLHGAAHQVLATEAQGYRTVEVETNCESFIPFGRFVEVLKLPGTRIELPLSNTSARLRLNGYHSSQALSPEQRELAQFRVACCEAIVTLQKQKASELQFPEFRLSGRKLDDAETRRQIAAYVQTSLGAQVTEAKGRGGKSKSLVLYGGRTLREFCDTYQNLGPNDDPHDALVPLEHLKGNREPRFSYRVHELMLEAWASVGFDTKKTSVAHVVRRLASLIQLENEQRVKNELPKLTVPSSASVAAFRDTLVTPAQLAVAHEGLKNARNKHGRGSTDVRALYAGEYVEVDECKVSLVLACKLLGKWEDRTPAEKAALEKFDNEIRKRFHILVMIDVATRMVLAWVISEQPKAEATLELLRMATRSKAREAELYGSELEPLPAIGIGHIKNDNGTGLRNAATVQAYAELGVMNTVSRAYNSTDRPYIERLFGTVENVLVASLHGYTGRKPGHLPGYDAMASGVIDITEFRAILSKFFLDEYPRMRHFGVGMGGRRPIDVFRELNKTRGLFRPIDPTRRRVVLGIKQEVTPNDEGVRVFGGLWFNSDQLQLCRDRRGFPRKVSVYIDPDDLHVATVIAEGEQDPIDVQIQVTCFADLTLPQVIDLLTLWRKENPDDLEIHEDRLSQLRRERHELMQSLEKTRKVPRSYFTHPELIQMAGTVLRGARVIPGRKAAAHADSFAQPGQLMALPGPRAPSYPIAEGSMPIDLTATDATDEANGNFVVSQPALQKPVRKPRKAPETTILEDTPPRIALGRPKTVKDLK